MNKFLPGAIIEFEYRLINHPEQWMVFKGIILENRTNSIRLWCLRNNHCSVFSKTLGKQRNVRITNE